MSIFQGPLVYFGTILAKHFGIPAINKTGGTLAAGTLVFVSGWDSTTKRWKITKAIASAGAARFANAVLTAAVTDQNSCTARPGANVTGLNTAGKTLGDPVWLDTTAGGYTYTAPTINVQLVGRVSKVDATDGAIEFDLVYSGGHVISQSDVASIGASTAAAGADSAGAGALPAGTADVYPTTAADDTKGVRMHVSDKVTGRRVFIGNGVSNKILKVYPAAGGTVNGAAADTAFSSVSGAGVWMFCLSGAGNTWLAE